MLSKSFRRGALLDGILGKPPNGVIEEYPVPARVRQALS